VLKKPIPGETPPAFSSEGVTLETSEARAGAWVVNKNEGKTKKMGFLETTGC